ncbi:uncharacterized protein C8R40DRAFT_1021061, partial [Lentinula edodes]|uniref:uncharacterized protein n=1 Tax=Lentinula edodes TaxID=5353 RepID=UPI001E8D4B39
FNLAVTERDVSSVKAYLKRTTHSDATGVDAATYSQLMGIPNNLLASLFSRAFHANNYHAIALESCVLKFASLLIHLKLSHALEQAQVIPPSQNGFRSGYHTNNNAFILRTLIEKAPYRVNCMHMTNTLFAAFVDISNAFPSTNQSSLWIKLASLGLTGQYFD